MADQSVLDITRSRLDGPHWIYEGAQRVLSDDGQITTPARAAWRRYAGPLDRDTVLRRTCSEWQCIAPHCHETMTRSEMASRPRRRWPTRARRVWAIPPD